MAFIIVGIIAMALLAVCLCGMLLVCCFRRWEASKGKGGIVMKGSLEGDQKGYGYGDGRTGREESVMFVVWVLP